MSIAALAGAASAVMPGLGGQTVTPSYGLGFRFTVKIDAVADLGAWQSCSGLKVEFKSMEPKRGGDYLSQRRLPDKVVYSKVVLKRAVLADTSSKVQDWLKASARNWMVGETSNASNATITLYDSSDEPVLEWVLKQARPAAWSGPDLDATSSKVAVETLELDHEGFEVRAVGVPPGAGQDSVDRQPELPVLSYEGKEIKFEFAPETLTLEMLGKGMQAAPNQATELHLSDVPNYKVAELTLQGPATKGNVTVLAKWATPAPAGKPETGNSTGGTPKPGGDDSLPIVTFKWGAEFHFTAQIKRLEGKYTRFSAAGQPTRASVGLTLQIVEDKSTASPPTTGAKNPHSGGISGRASHVLTEADTLPLLAREHYGTPGSWREIAAANGIDDPMRVHPGRLLYLPSITELNGGRRS